MKKIQYHLQASNQWLQELHQYIPSDLINNNLYLHPEIGQGSLQVMEIQKGLYITFIQVKLKTSMVLERIAAASNHHFIINFHFSKLEISRQIKEQSYTLGFKNNSILLSSAMTASKLSVPPNIPLEVFNITFSKDWLLKNGIGKQDENHFLKQILQNQEPVYLFENLDYTFEKNIQQIKQHQKENNQLALFSNVLQVLAHFFSKIQNRKTDKIRAINPHDLRQLMAVRTEIEQDWANVKNNEVLAKTAKMSLSKFKRLFKQVFGTSPYRYHLNYKMEKAMELLQRKAFSVSEVGAYMGYSNLSQFSKAFKKYHHILPKEVK